MIYEYKLYLKSGVSFTIWAKEMNIKRTIGGEFSALEWTSVNDPLALPKLIHINLDELVAVICVGQKHDPSIEKETQ